MPKLPQIIVAVLIALLWVLVVVRFAPVIIDKEIRRQDIACATNAARGYPVKCAEAR